MPILSSSFAYLFWLPNNNKGKYLKLCMGYSDETYYVDNTGLKYFTHVFCCEWAYQEPNLHISSDWLITTKTNNPESYIYGLIYCNRTWYVGSTWLKYYPCVLLLLMHIWSTSFAYFIWLANNYKVKYAEFYMGYSHQIWYVGSTRLNYYDVFCFCWQAY